MRLIKTMPEMEAREELAALRQAIDETDAELISLLKRRLSLVKQAAAVKADLGEGSRSLEREAYLLESREAQALEHDLPSGLISDLLRRLLRESYKEGAGRHFTCTRHTERPLVLVGGAGAMGRIFEKYFKASGYRVRILGADDWEQASEILKNALVVMLCVPIDVTEEVIMRLRGKIPEDAVLCDITSVKAPMVRCMLEAHSGPVLGLHPMFGPDIKGMVKQVIVDCGGRFPEQSCFLTEQFEIWGAKVCQCTPEEHDQAMGIIQAMRHFTTYCYGLFLSRENPNLTKILDLSSPIYHLELLMVGRLFAQDPVLYCDIIMSSEHNLKLIEEYEDCIREQLKVVAVKDREEFIRRFLEARAYFGEHAQEFLKESGQLLARVNDDLR